MQYEYRIGCVLGKASSERLYTFHYIALACTERHNLAPIKPSNPKYIPKPYEKMCYPGQRVQIDIKYVPDACIVGDAKAESKKFHQYTAVDEYSRFRYLEAFEEHNTYTSAMFLKHMLQAFKATPHISYHKAKDPRSISAKSLRA